MADIIILVFIKKFFARSREFLFLTTWDDIPTELLISPRFETIDKNEIF